MNDQFSPSASSKLNKPFAAFFFFLLRTVAGFESAESPPTSFRFADDVFGLGMTGLALSVFSTGLVDAGDLSTFGDGDRDDLPAAEVSIAIRM